MKFTFNQKGKYNKSYWSCLVWFDLNKENHIRYLKTTNEINFMLKHTDLAEILKQHILVEPKSKRNSLKRLFDIAIKEAIESEQIYNKDSDSESE